MKKTRSRKISWKSDFDYSHKLNQEDLEFLIAFNAGYYGADIKSLAAHREVSAELRKEIYHSQYAARHDLLNNK